MSDTDLDKRLQLANRIAKSAGQLTLNYFQTNRFEVIRKDDNSPLTVADQEAEKFLRAQIAEMFPEDSIVGEEFGETQGDSEFTWVLDPIDGTKSFISGVPLYGTMVAVVHGNSDPKIRRSVIGSVYMPGLDVGIYASQGNGAWSFQGDNKPAPATVSNVSKLNDAVLVTSQVETFGRRDAKSVYDQLAKSVYFCRTWGDVYGYYLVATGRVEVMIDPMLNIWDAAAVQPIIEEAGGRFTDWANAERIDAGEAIGSNGLVHDEIIAMTREFAGKLPSE